MYSKSSFKIDYCSNGATTKMPIVDFGHLNGPSRSSHVSATFQLLHFTVDLTWRKKRLTFSSFGLRQP